MSILNLFPILFNCLLVILLELENQSLFYVPHAISFEVGIGKLFQTLFG